MAKRRFRDVKQGRVKEVKKQKEKEFNFIDKKTYFKIWLTDVFMLGMPIVYIVIYAVFGSREGFAANRLEGWIYILIPLTIIEIIFLTTISKTPGMKYFGTKLISLKTGQKPPFLTILLRQILAKVTFFTFAWIFIFFSSKTQNIHDFILNTAIVYEE